MFNLALLAYLELNFSNPILAHPNTPLVSDYGSFWDRFKIELKLVLAFSSHRLVKVN